jgi:hypothetical protein
MVPDLEQTPYELLLNARECLADTFLHFFPNILDWIPALRHCDCGDNSSQFGSVLHENAIVFRKPFFHFCKEAVSCSELVFRLTVLSASSV